jgi:hypothetical protein
VTELPIHPWAPLLLADPSPCLRMLVLRELLGRPADDGEVTELAGLREGDPMVAGLLELQEADGSWQQTDPSVAGTSGHGEAYVPTGRALTRLGYLGFGPEHPAVQGGAEYLFSQQQSDGSWPLPRRGVDGERTPGYSMVPLQTALPLRGLAACGYATDARAERAYEWLLAQRLPDGAWPTGLASGVHGGVAGYRRLAHSRWGCRSNTTGALICLALHPQQRSSPEARRALDLLLGRETRETHVLGYEVARMAGFEPAHGFLTYYARFDLAMILDLCWRTGAPLADERVADLVNFVRGLQGPYGLWECTLQSQAVRWLTFDLLRSLSRLEGHTDWLSLEPRTPFRPYPRRQRRY